MSKHRYDRQTRLEGFGIKGQELLGNARILVVGAGGLGVPICTYLNAMGVGTLGIVDGDTIDQTNLHRQPAYGPEDVGKPKVSVLAQVLKKQNPASLIRTHREFLGPANALELLEPYDLVVDATDRIPTRYLLDDACVIQKIPWVYGALHGFEGQVSVFNYREGPTYRCLFPRIPKQGEIPDCNQLGTLGILPGIVGSLQALEAVKVVCGLGTVLSGKLLLYNALDQQTQLINFGRDLSQDARKIRDDAHYAPDLCEAGGGVTLSQYREKARKGRPPLLVDVREPHEFETNHLPEAVNIPLIELEHALESLDVPRELYFICHTGSRSSQAFRKLNGRLKTATIYWIQGGMRDIQAGQP